jgi:hypothetical protein
VISESSIPHGREHSIQWLARELNVDRLSLAGMLLGGRAPEVEAKKKFTVAEAFETWTARSEGEELRNRKVKAKAETAEDPAKSPTSAQSRRDSGSRIKTIHANNMGVSKYSARSRR